ncbi:MAG: TrmH family RNA methyltransferase [Treponema sp.]|nr:TrmH family RNA methyltransferase [Treponema sp.]
MIPLDKLIKVPRSQRLRKMVSLVGTGERNILAAGTISVEDSQYFYSMMELLINDKGLSSSAVELFKAAQESFLSAMENKNISEIRRLLNSVYHLILSVTGRNQADWDFIGTDGALDISKRRPFKGMFVYLEDIRSPFNVGAMFRAAESFGAEKIWLSPLCTDPRHKRALRTAMGCVDALPWERLHNDPFIAKREKELKEGSTQTEDFLKLPFFALETGGVPLAEFKFPPHGIMIAGSEELGVSPGALAAADASLGRVSITTYGVKGSLNVSVAFGIVMQAWANYLIHI